MSSIQQGFLYAGFERKWAWDSRGRTLFLSYPESRETDPWLICDIMHKLTYFKPERILIRVKERLLEVREQYVGLLQDLSREIEKEKEELYKRLLEKREENSLGLNSIRGILSIRPFYGSVYSKPLLRLPASVKLFSERGLQEFEGVFQGSWLAEHSYVLGHLLYCVNAKDGYYRVFFKSDDYFWIEKELSKILRLAYSKRMLRTGRFKDIFSYRFKAGLRFLKVLAQLEAAEPVGSIVKHAVYSSIGLSKIYPLLNDSGVQCFFLDDVGRRIYVDHARFGRLSTNLVFKERDFESLVSLVKRESGLNLDYSNPSIKTAIVFDRVLTRVSIDIPPLALGKGVLDVRKHVANVLHLRVLLGSGYFSVEAAAFLIFAILNRANISIVGEPNSGKTSLLNFLSYFAPSWWRIVHVEDALETLPPRVFDQHRVVYIVEPFETKGRSDTKTLEIVKALHRTPSYLILGEVQTGSHVKAMFRAVSAGLRIMHTAHAASGRGFVKRLVDVYNIPRILLSELDLIIVMKRLEANNFVKRFIGEIAVIDGDSNLIEIFSRRTVTDELCCYLGLESSGFFGKLAGLSCIDEKNLQEEYEAILKMVEENRFSDNFTVKRLVQKIHVETLGKTGGGFQK
ncbi:MAG: type II/IV secretion system ATPase subunit [Candidatus Brockarchaeota archaeon]|nr:type II/IV secretion system ATPase subunit [Candidatus Brockarchaeota archaeon]